MSQSSHPVGLKMVDACIVIVIGNKIVFVYVYVLETMVMDVQYVFI